MNEVPNRQKGKIMERNYEEIFQKVLDYEQALHEKNRKRIKIGLKCIWIVPLFFLALLFLTGSNKVIFRPSGTEPKIKAYVFAKATTRAAAEQLLETLAAEATATLQA